MKFEQLFVTLSEKIKKEIKTIKDITLDIEYLKIYKSLLEINVDFSKIELFEIIPCTIIKLE